MTNSGRQAIAPASLENGTWARWRELTRWSVGDPFQVCRDRGLARVLQMIPSASVHSQIPRMVIAGGQQVFVIENDKTVSWVLSGDHGCGFLSGEFGRYRLPKRMTDHL